MSDRATRVHPGKPVIVDRYTAGARINHWITAASLILLALSGLALFHPSLFFLTGLFGGGADRRASSIPGSASCCSSASPACSSASGRQSLETRGRDLAGAHPRRAEHARGEPARGRQVQCRPEVRVLGDVDPDHRADFERPRDLGAVFLRAHTSIDQKRLALLVHAIAAVAIICVWIMHVYAAIWVRGTIRAMTTARSPAAGPGGITANGCAELVTMKPTDRDRSPPNRARRSTGTTWPVRFVR